MSPLIPATPITAPAAGVGTRDYEHIALGTDPIDEYERESGDPHVMAIATDDGLRTRIDQQSLGSTAGLEKESFRGPWGFLAIPRLGLAKVVQRELMKLDHGFRSARSCAWTDSHDIPGEPSLSRASNSAGKSGSSSDQPGGSPETVSMRSVASSRRSASDNSIADFKTSSRVADIITSKWQCDFSNRSMLHFTVADARILRDACSRRCRRVQVRSSAQSCDEDCR